MNTEKQSFDSRPSYVDVHILVVDDDATSLAIVSTMLRKWKYQVATAKNPVDALATLRTKKGYFDLVITDLHMPYMDGFDLQKRVDEEFKLPVIMMSADEKDSVIMRYLEGGVAFYIVKPVNPDDLKNVWQYAVAAKKGMSIAIEDIGTFNTSTSNNIITSTTSVIDRYNGESNFVDKSPISSDLEENSDHYHDHIKKVDNNSKRKGSKRGTKDDGEETSSHQQPDAPRKAKVVWTNSLHTSFLMAISHLGLDKAVPKRILEFMNVPGLTRENVASHLQKYRLFLKKVAEKGMASMTKIQFEKIFKSSFANGHSSLIYKTYQKQYPELLRQYNLLNSSKTPQSSLTCSSHISLLHNPNQQAASTSRSVPQQNTTQANTTYQQPLLGNTTTPINYQSNTFANGFNSISTNSTKGNSMPQLFTTSPLNYNFKVTTSGIGNTIRPLTDINKVILPNSSTCPGNNFAGTRGINSGGDELIGFKFSESSGFVAPKGNIGNTNYDYFEQVNNSDNNGQKSHLEYLPQYSPTNQLYGLSNILGGGGGNNSEFQDNSTAFKGNSDLAQQFVNDDDFINMFLNHDNLHCPPNPNEQQSDEVPSDISDVTFQADEEMNPSENQVQDPHFSASYYLQDNVPFEQSFGKVNEQGQNHENEVNMIYSTGDYYYPSFDRFNSQKQQGNEETEKHHVYKEWDDILEALWGIDE